MDLPYDPQKLGRRFRFSGEHSVFRYGEDKIIKFPSGPIHKFSADEALRKIKNEVHLVKKYLDGFVIPTELYFYKEKGTKTYCIIQDFIQGRPLKLADMQDENLKKQLQELFRANQEMFKTTRYTLEFFGLTGLLFHAFNKTMENIIVTPDNKLRIIDIGLISDLNMVSSSFILRWFIQWAMKRQWKLLGMYVN